MVKNIIILGDPLYKSEAGYINYGFMKAFQYLQYNVYCVNNDNKDILNDLGDTDNMYIINDLKNNKLIPINTTNYYVLIKYTSKEFLKMPYKLVIKEYDTTIPQWRIDTYKHLGNNVYHRKFNMIMPWGSTLTPVEIMNNLKNFVELKDREELFMTRTYNKDMLQKINNSNVKICLKKMISVENEKELLRNAKFSCCLSYTPTKIDYRVITHISYGVMCATDCPLTHAYLNNKTLYIDDITNMETLTNDYYSSFKKNDLFDLMENVCNNHTFSNRVKLILDYFKLN